MFSPYSRRCPTLRWKEARGHLTYLQYRPIFEARGENIHDYRIMTVVRNPWAWHVSWFNYVRKDVGGRSSGLRIEHEQFKHMTFSQYIDWLDDESAPESPQRYIRKQQSDWICDESGRIRVDDVLHQETLLDDLNGLVDRLNLAVRPSGKRLNVSTTDDYRRYFTSSEVDRIARRHHRDNEMFGYSFE